MGMLVNREITSNDISSYSLSIEALFNFCTNWKLLSIWLKGLAKQNKKQFSFSPFIVSQIGYKDLIEVNLDPQNYSNTNKLSSVEYTNNKWFVN